MVNCLEYLSNNKYNLSGYSPDTFYFLFNTDTEGEQECEALFLYLEARYG